MNAVRRCCIGLVLLLLCAEAPGGEPEKFFYLAVPSAPAKCLFFSCVRFDSKGRPVAPTGKKAPVFTLWRSGYWDEKEPDIAVKNPGDWANALEVRARKTVAAKPEMSQFPPQVVEFFVAVEKLRAAAVNPRLIAEPLFQNQGFVGWENARHLDVLAVPDPFGPQERTRALLRCMGAPERQLDQDPGPWLKELLASLGVKVQSARYYPEYNTFVFEAGADLNTTMETLFSPMTGH